MEKQQKWLQQEMSQLEVKVTAEQQSRLVQVCYAHCIYLWLASLT